MQQAFKRCCELLDLENSKEDEAEKQKQQIREGIENLSPEMLEGTRAG